MIPRQWTRRVGSLLLTATALFLGLCLLTYSPGDSVLLSSHPQQPPHNLGGAFGTWIGVIGRSGFGQASFVLPALCLLLAWRLWRGHRPEIHVAPLLIAVASMMASVGTLLALRGTDAASRTALGGVAGLLCARAGSYYIGTFGTILTAGCVGLLSWLVVSGQLLQATGIGALRRLIVSLISRWRSVALTSLRAGSSAAVRQVGSTVQGATGTASASPAPTVRLASRLAAESASAQTSAPPRVKIRAVQEPKLKSAPALAKRAMPDGFRCPPLDALTTPPPISQRLLAENLQTNAKVLEETLRDFGVEAKVVNIDRGPAVTRYELKPAPGVKLTKIASLTDELALVLKTANCHIVAPLPGKGLVGIDVPNTTTTIVYLKELLTASAFEKVRSPLALPIGKDVSGQAVVADLRDFPHLLIAGATGSGKTVCLNSLLVGFLSHATPEEVRFLMIDPKMVELAAFNGIPHLIAPVVTDTKKASAALAWAVSEMERRFQLFSDIGVRNIHSYNERTRSHGSTSPPAGNGDADSQAQGPLPYLVVVIDELADLMMVSSQEVEGTITRLAQLSRAVGIHIILATQRPSVDVVTGVIKANFPARIAFQVASKVDSRTILDMNGADKLLGRGDLLFLPPGAAKPIRAQGALITDAEIERVTTFLKEQGAPAYDERLLEAQRQPAGAGGVMSGEKDELYAMAKEVVLNAGQASTSLLQRRLRLGYGRAARILDLMEQEGLVGPPQGSKPREVLVSREDKESKVET